MQRILDNNYLAAIYLRLSKEDGDLSTAGGKTESNSVLFVLGNPKNPVFMRVSGDGNLFFDFD